MSNSKSGDAMERSTTTVGRSPRLDSLDLAESGSTRPGEPSEIGTREYGVVALDDKATGRRRATTLL